MVLKWAWNHAHKSDRPEFIFSCKRKNRLRYFFVSGPPRISVRPLWAGVERQTRAPPSIVRLWFSTFTHARLALALGRLKKRKKITRPALYARPGWCQFSPSIAGVHARDGYKIEYLNEFRAVRVLHSASTCMYFNTAKHELLEVSLLMFKLSYLNTQRRCTHFMWSRAK